MKHILSADTRRTASLWKTCTLLLIALFITACAVKALWTVDVSGTDITNHNAVFGVKLAVGEQGESYTVHLPSGTSMNTLQKFDTDGNLLWRVSDINARGLYLYPNLLPAGGENPEQLHLLAVNGIAGVVWRVLDTDGNEQEQRDIPAALVPPLGLSTFHLANPGTLLVTSTARSSTPGEPTAPGTLYEVTASGMRVVHETPYPARSLSVQTDAQGNIYLTSSHSLIDSAIPSFVVKLNAAYEPQWEALLPEEARVDGSEKPVAAANGDLHLVESAGDGLLRIRSFDAATGTQRVIDLADTTNADILGAAADNGIYVLSRNQYEGVALQASLYQWSILHLADDGTLSSVIPAGEFLPVWPNVEMDVRHGFTVRTMERKVLARYQGGVEKISLRGGLDLYGLDGVLKRSIQGKAAIHSEVDAWPVRVDQIGETLYGMQQDAAGAVYTLVAETWESVGELEPLVPDNVVHLRKY